MSRSNEAGARTSIGAVAFAAALIVLAFSAPVSAAGPGGWENVGGGLNDQVFALNTDAPGQLIVGGRFTDAGGNTNADKIASWNGSGWSAFGPNESLGGGAGFVNAIAVSGNKVIVGGSFNGVGAVDNLAVWDGTNWGTYCSSINGPVDTFATIGNTLYVGGSFTNAGGLDEADNLIKCNLTTGEFEGATVNTSGDISGRVQALVAVGDTLYAGGTFINLDGIAEADYLARYNGTWTFVGTGLTPGTPALNTANVDALATDGTNVYVGTDDKEIADIPNANYVARWDGAAWHAVGTGIESGGGYFPDPTAIGELLVAGSNLYATGSWLDASENPLADAVGVYSNGAWSNVGSNGFGNGPFLGNGNALAFFNGVPIVGGAFVNAGGDQLADRIASFGSTASQPPSPSPPPAAGGPAAKFKKTPKKKVYTNGKKAKVTFTFESATATGFLCKLDKKDFAPCKSPKKVKAKIGKHTFSVAGVDAAGTAGVPDAFKFKVVKKSKKRG